MSVVEAPAVPLKLVRLRAKDAAVTAGCMVSALAITWLIYFRLSSLNGRSAFVLIWIASFVLLYWLAVGEMEGRMAANDKLARMVTSSLALSLLLALLLIVGFIFVTGIKALTPAFFTHSMEGVGPLDPASKGGALHALIGTLEQILLAALISVPLGFATAVFLNEVGGRLRRPVRIFVNAMSGVPSIVAGLFVYAIWIIQYGHRFSGFAASLALALLMLPTVTRTAEEVLRLVPGGLREASLALGSQEWATTWRVVLPTAKSGLVTAAILGVARSVGETAPLIMTSFGSPVTNTNPFKDPQSALPLYAYGLLNSPLPSDRDRAFAGALLLVFIVLALFLSARRISAGGRTGARRISLRLSTRKGTN